MICNQTKVILISTTKHQQLTHPETTVMGGMFATVQPADALTDAVERMNDDACGLG